MKKEYSLLKYVLKKNTNIKLDLEYLDAVNNLYKYYIIYYPIFFTSQKISDKVYIVNLLFKCFNCYKNINDGFLFNIKFKFYQKHDYPFDFTQKIVKTIFENYIYINSLNKAYIYSHLMNL